MRVLVPALAILLACCNLCACGEARFVAPTAVSTGLPAAGEDRFRFTCGSADEDACADVKAALERHIPRVRRDLEFAGATQYLVEIFPDQRSYDAALDDPSVAGSPACSGNGKILLVSPKYPIRVQGITYEQRLTMAVHEYAHLLVNEINPDAPIWLAEGIACYEGSEGRYIEKGGGISKALAPIPFSAIDDAYYSTPGADVYSFLAVKYIVDTAGYDTLNRLMRAPAEFENILGLSKSDFSTQWANYMQSYMD